MHAKCWHLCWLLMLDSGSYQQPFHNLPVQLHARTPLPCYPRGADCYTCILPLSIKGLSNSHKHRVNIVVQLRAGILAAHHDSQLIVVCCSLMLPCVFIHQTMLSVHCHPLVLPEIQPARVTETCSHRQAEAYCTGSWCIGRYHTVRACKGCPGQSASARC